MLIQNAKPRAGYLTETGAAIPPAALGRRAGCSEVQCGALLEELVERGVLARSRNGILYDPGVVNAAEKRARDAERQARRRARLRGVDAPASRDVTRDSGRDVERDVTGVRTPHAVERDVTLRTPASRDVTPAHPLKIVNDFTDKAGHARDVTQVRTPHAVTRDVTLRTPASRDVTQVRPLSLLLSLYEEFRKKKEEERDDAARAELADALAGVVQGELPQIVVTWGGRRPIRERARDAALALLMDEGPERAVARYVAAHRLLRVGSLAQLGQLVADELVRERRQAGAARGAAGAPPAKVNYGGINGF